MIELRSRPLPDRDLIIHIVYEKRQFSDPQARSVVCVWSRDLVQLAAKIV